MPYICVNFLKEKVSFGLRIVAQGAENKCASTQYRSDMRPFLPIFSSTPLSGGAPNKDLEKGTKNQQLIIHFLTT
ncbi:MAG: hypothetical protein IJT30_11410 [Muribaculaceae bacterium]|nr:hypothetical protein [Muribaculaceae bacterium]